MQKEVWGRSFYFFVFFVCIYMFSIGLYEMVDPSSDSSITSIMIQMSGIFAGSMIAALLVKLKSFKFVAAIGPLVILGNITSAICLIVQSDSID